MLSTHATTQPGRRQKCSSMRTSRSMTTRNLCPRTGELRTCGVEVQVGGRPCRPPARPARLRAHVPQQRRPAALAGELAAQRVAKRVDAVVAGVFAEQVAPVGEGVGRRRRERQREEEREQSHLRSQQRREVGLSDVEHGAGRLNSLAKLLARPRSLVLLLRGCLTKVT